MFGTSDIYSLGRENMEDQKGNRGHVWVGGTADMGVGTLAAWALSTALRTTCRNAATSRYLLWIQSEILEFIHVHMRPGLIE